MLNKPSPKSKIKFLPECDVGQLARSGLALHAPPFTFRIRSSSRILAKALRFAYADYELLDTDDFVDFDLNVVPHRGVRRWFRPLIEISVDGKFPFSPLPSTQVFPLLEWAMNWCVTANAHQFLMCHSAVLARDDLAVILPAPPGSGKSTLCAGLMLSGWRLLSDELALICPESAKLTPHVRPVSLKNSSIPLIAGHFPAALLTDSVRDTIKGVVAHLRPTAHSVEESQTSATPRWLIFPNFVADSIFDLSSLGKAEALVELARNAFNLPLLGIKGLNALEAVVESCDCYSLRYSNLGEAVAEIEALSASFASR